MLSTQWKGVIIMGIMLIFLLAVYLLFKYLRKIIHPEKGWKRLLLWVAEV